MNDASSDGVASANARSYNDLERQRYIEGAPHIQHPRIALRYDGLLERVLTEATQRTPTPCVLDLGAGEGSVTEKALQRGASVVAVDVAAGRLDQLRCRCTKWAVALETIQADAVGAVDLLERQGRSFDVVTAIAFLHHVPDYIDLLRRAAALLTSHGQVLTFEDPMRYDSLPLWDKGVSRVSYFGWRLGQGDVLNGAIRHLRRRLGIFRDDDADNVEYHVVRNGVDQEAMQRLFAEIGMGCEMTCYFSTQSAWWQRIGERLGAKNAFGMRAWKL